MKYDVFISHSTKDKKATETVVDYLESNGIACFVSYRDIPHCDNWAEILVKAIEDSAMVVYIHSESANVSEQVTREVQISIDDYKKPLVTYRLTSEPFKGAKKFFIQTLNWIDSLIDPKDGLEELLRSVKDTLAGQETKTIEQNFSRLGLFIRRHKLPIAIVLLSVVLVTCGCLFAGSAKKTRIEKLEQARQELFNKDLDAYQNYISSARRFIGAKDSAVVMMASIDSAAAIVAKYQDTSHESSFDADLDNLRQEAMSTIARMEQDCKQRIINFNKTFLLVPMAEIKSDIVSELARLEEMDAILGKEPDKEIATIKSALGL